MQEEHARRIYDEHFSRLYRYFYYKSVPRDASEDSTQEAFLRFFDKYGARCGSLSSEEVTKILYGVARNVYREWVRDAVKHQSVELDDSIVHGITQEEYEDESFYDELLALGELLKTGIAELSNERMQQVLTMRFLEDKTRAEVAATLQMTEKAVHVYQRRAIAALQVWVSKQELSKAVSPTPYNI